MAKRISKKLLAGLGGALAFSTTALVSGLGIKTIVNNVQNNEQRFNFNRISEAGFNQIPNLSTPTKDMFLDTTRLGNFHAGSVSKGQTLTPWGWLGLYTENNQVSDNKPLHQKLALTGWNGEILWVNDDFQGESFADNKADIFDIKYDWNTDLIFLARSGNPNGLFKPAQVTEVGENSLIIDVLDAKTGTKLWRIENGSGSTNDLHDFAWRSFFALREDFFNVDTDIKRIKDLYSFDVTSLAGQNNEALAFYMPNLMQLYQKSNNSATQGTLPNFAKVLENFKIIARGWVIERSGANAGFKTRLVDPLKSTQINNQSWTFSDANTGQSETLNTNDFYLLANPFWTATSQSHEFVLHFFVANSNGDVYHKTIGFRLNAPQPERNDVLSQFDKTEKVTTANATSGNLLNMKLKAGNWANNAATWNPNFINANLRINKNMFDNNIVTFAFPVAASQNASDNYPIFDVAQIKINNQGLIDTSNVNGKLSSRIFDLGNQILSANNGNINFWPDSTNNSLTHNYNRLISISPFDNTFIYNAMPNLQGIDNNIYNANDRSNKFLNFWLVDAKTGQYKPFVISNDAGLNGAIPRSIINVEALLKEGFTFDLNSLESSGAINVYFNHSGSDRNDWYGSPSANDAGMRSAKIGLLNSIVDGSSSWITNITNPISFNSNKLIQIDDDSFATLIHSRADMTKWYARTQYNLDHPGNVWKADQQINGRANVNTRVQADVFNSAITNNKVKQQEGVDLVSHWQVGQGKYNNSSAKRSNYERLTVKRPIIKAKNSSQQQVLEITTSYDVNAATSSKYQTIFGFDAAAKEKLTFKFDQQIENASWQIFSSWSKDAKMLNHATSSDNINFTSSLTDISGAPQWFDARQSTAGTSANFFGQFHNAISPNTASNQSDLSLRTMLKIERPANGPSWLSQADRRFFDPYPISGTEYNNETSFQQVLNELIAWKAQNVDLGEDQTNQASGLANLTIKAFLQVNPRVVKANGSPNPVIYKKGNQQILILDNKGQAIIYDDQYNQERTIYDQSATSYEQMVNYGYGNSVQSALTKSFKNVPSANTKLLINVDLNNLSTTLLNKGNNQNAVFSIEYQSQQQDKLVIKPANPGDQNWFSNRFSSFNKMLNLFAVFEYQNQSDDVTTGTWKPLDDQPLKLWTDNELQANLNQNGGSLVLDTTKKDIKRVRVRLVTKTNSGDPSEANDFIKWKNWDPNSEKLVSKVHVLQPQKITIDKAWFNNTTLTIVQTNNTLDQLQASDLTNYENQIREELKRANNNSEAFASQVEIKYIFENQTYSDAAGLANAITTALNDSNRQDKGVFALWNGSEGLKITVQLQIKSAVDDSYVLVDPQGTIITDEAERSGDLKSNIATKIDLSDYFNQLETTALQAVQDAQNGRLTSFEMPAVKTGKFTGQTYEQMLAILNAVGLNFQFKEQTDSNSAWSNWMAKDQIHNYNPQDPSLMVGLSISGQFNIKVFVKTTAVDANYDGIKVKLNLPKLVKFPQDLTTLINNFNQKNPFGGNTYQLDLDTTKLQTAEASVVNAIKEASEGNAITGNYDNLASALEFKYQLGNSTFLSAAKLKEYLAQETNDQSSNALELKISLKTIANTDPEFILDAANNEKEITLQQDNNQVIKKWIHGTQYETALKAANPVVPGGTKNALTYTFVQDLQPFATSNNFPQGLTLEYQIDGIGNWIPGQLPTTVADTVQNIKIRIAKRNNENIYVYGPEESQSQTEATIDLTQIPVLITVNKDWFSEVAITDQVIELDALDANVLTTWEDKIWQKSGLAAELKAKVTIKYSFLNGPERANLDKNTLKAKLLAEQTKYADQTHHGIVKLQDAAQTTTNGIVIRATFAKVDPADQTVQFIDQNGANIGDNETNKLTGDVNTQKIQSTFDLSTYINHLKTNATNITTENGAAGTIAADGLVPPVVNGQADQVLFANQSFSTIEEWLKKAGLTFLWSVDGQSDWKPTNQIRNYDPQRGQLFLALQNQSTNLKVKIDNSLTVGVQNNSFSSPITIQLNAPKVINVQASAAAVMKPFFSGNTKYLNVDTTNIKAEITKILQNLGNQFQNAPLTLMVKVGSEAFVDYKELETTLSQKQTDLSSSVVTVKFAIEANQSNTDDFQLVAGGDAELTLINDPSQIKIFVNDQGIFEDLKTKSKLTGQDNTSFTINWPNGWNIDPNTGIFSANNIGQGLRLEFSFSDLDQVDTNVGTDVQTQWVSKMPTSYELNQKKLYVRIQTQANYVYEKIASHESNSPITPNNQEYKFALDLNLPQLIKLDSTWLNQQFSSQQILLENLKVANFDAYENAIKNQMAYDQEIKDKISINYSFDGQDNLTKDQLISELSAYQQAFADQNKNFGLLQLWNQNFGQKISAKFVKTDPNDTNYEIQVFNGNNTHDLDLSQVVTTIDLSAVLNWLQTIKVEVQPDGNKPNSIANLVFKPIDANADLHFNQKSWEQFKNTLSHFGIQTQFRSLTATNINQPDIDWVNDQALIKTYDPTIGKIQVRFKFDNSKTSNIQIKLSASEIVLGTNNQPTKAFDVKLGIKLAVQIDQQIVQNFINNQDTFSGNTKNLTISETNENQMIEDIKAANVLNNPEFARMQLLVEYQMGNGQANDQWRNRTDFIQYLSDQTTDQTTNKIVFRFAIATNQDADFSVNQNINILHEHEAPNAGIKIPYFINKNQWESQAGNVAISGNNQNIIWNWKGLTVDSANLVTVPAGSGLKVQFSTKANVNYTDAEATDLTQGWSDNRPQSLPVDTDDLYIRFVAANNGFIYEAQSDNSAIAHKVLLENFKFLIPVENQWLTQNLIVANGGFIDQLQQKDLEQYEATVLNHISPDNLKNKVGLSYEFNGQTNLTKEALFAKIQAFLQDFSEPNLGILQLDNGHQGLAIKATFVIKPTNPGTDREYGLFEANNQLTNKINTSDIKTNIDLQPYISYLKSNPIQVEGANSTTGTLKRIVMPNFPAGTMPFGGKSFEVVQKRLAQLGIKFEAKALGNNVPTQWSSIEDLKKYDPNNGQIQLRLVFEQPQKAQNLVLSILTDKDQDANASAIEIELNLKVPLKVEINDQTVDTEFINNDSISGNTRFLTIDAVKEQALIAAIIEENKQTNVGFEQLKGKLKIEYQIEGSTEWKELAAFQAFLANAQQNWTSNKIKFHFIIADNSADFIIDNNQFILQPEEIGNKATKVKIYIHEQNYETLAQQIQVSGSSSNLVYQWPKGLPINPANGQISGVNGLKIQYTTKKDQVNADYDGTNQNPAQGWVDQQVNQIDPVDRYLAIQLVGADGYVYGPQFKTQSPQPNDQTVPWNIHKIDVAAVVSEIAIDMDPLQQISFSGEFPQINVAQIQQLETQVKAQVNNVSALQAQMKFAYQVSWKNQILFNFGTLNELQAWMQSYENAESANLLKFNAGNTTQFATITVRLEAIDPKQYVVLDKNATGDFAAKKASAEKGKVANTNDYATVFDLQAYQALLLKKFVELPENATANNIAGFNPPGMESINDGSFLAGKTYSEIKTILANLGISIEFNAPQNNGTSQWVDQSAIQGLNQKNELFMRFRVTDIAGANLTQLAATFKIKTAANPNGILDNNNNFATEQIKLKVDLPILITVNSADLNQEKLKLKGNTWTIANTSEIKQEAQRLIQQAKTNNNTNNTNVDNAPLKIQFQLPGLTDGQNNAWFEIDTLATLLKSSDTNWNTNEIKVRWFIDETSIDVDGFRYQISDKNEITLQPHETSATAGLKMYIHQKTKYSDSATIKQKLKPSGTSEDYIINGLDAWTAMLNSEAQGLTMQFSNAKQPQNSTDWTTYQNNNDLPKPLNADKDLWFRYEVKAGYEYQGAMTIDASHSEAVKLDTSGIKLILELTKDWLKLITLNGDLKELTIDEAAAQQQLIASGQLPTNQQDLVFFEYSFDNQQWLKADAFKDLLNQQAGQKDQANFILKREEIKVRFGLKSDADSSDYQLKIDGQLITSTNRDQHNVQLIDTTLNDGVRGYIEIQHLQHFVANNFAIQGTNNAPRLIVNKRSEMDTLMQNYASDNLFDILISTKKSANGAWDWTNSQSILTPNKNFVDQDRGLIDLGVKLDANKQVALKFVATNNKYDIYQNSQQQPNGYVLDISANVKITVEIENPFLSANKGIGVRFRDDNDQAKFYQGQGGFKLTTLNLSTNQSNTESALTFLQNSALTTVEKNALEFVYHVFETQPSLEEWQQVSQKEIINDYQNKTWNSLSELFDNTNNSFTKPLNLKVGQFVSIAIRVKEEFATVEDGFVLKDDAHSVLDPVGFQQNKQTLVGRVSGYKVNVDQVKIATDEIQLTNMEQNSLVPLDGFALLQRINFKQDDLGNYLGVQLKIKLYNDFHRNSSNQILQAANQKLVKRVEDPDGQNKGNYKTADGQDILDQAGNPIPILVDQNGKLTAPVEENQPTREKMLDDFGDGVFGFNIVNQIDPEYGLFKNQKIEIEYQARTGANTNGLADFVLDQNQHSVNIQQWVSPQIKFVIDNSKKISYSFVQDDFSPENIQYEGNDLQNPTETISGSSHIASALKLVRNENNQTTVITGDGASSAQILEQQLLQDFGGQLRFEYTYSQADGPEITTQGIDIYKLRNLKNNDRIVIRIVAEDPELVFLEAPNPLVINVKGLIGSAPNKEKLRFLRVEQNGQIDGQGTFRILVDDPQNDGVTDDMLLRGWKFMIQVWDANKTIKIPWTDQQDQIKGLANGDKVEWKLVDERNNHVQDAYYNTVAQQHEINPADGSTIYNFAEVNYQSGAQSQVVYRDDIGVYPESDQVYPENSGFVISGLEAAIEKFPISETGFDNVFVTLNPTYEGIDGQGALKFDEQYLNQLYYVDTEGRLNARSQNELKLLATNSDTEIEEVTLSRFLANVTFFTADPRLEPLQNGFKFTSNETNITNYLKNGDQLWAQFDVIQQNENGSQSTTLTTQLPDVSGLSDVPDNMGPLWFVLMGAGTVMTLGLLTIIYFWLRHRKLK